MLRNRVKPENLLIVFLFFAVLVVGFVFACTDAEYNYNQQIARGFISKDAVFFDLDNLSYQEAFYMVINGEEDYPDTEIDTTPKAAADASFVLENKVLDNGQTAIESLLSSGNGKYYASLHNGTMRGMLYKGKITLPPLLSGRFFSEDECLNDSPLAVIGRAYKEAVYSRDGKQFLKYMNKEYMVVGVVGFSGDSPIDDIIFVNLGSLTPEEQLAGTYYIDCSSNNRAIYRQMNALSESLFGCGLKQRKIPMAFIDLVAGGMYMKTYLKILMIVLGAIAFTNVLIQSIRKKYIEIAVMKIQGIELKKIYSKTIKSVVITAAIGTLLGIMVNTGMIVFGVFSLPVKWLIRYCSVLLGAGLGMMFIWILIVFIVEWKLDPKGVIQKV